MPHSHAHLWPLFEKINKSLNNTNTFLLDISIPLIDYLLNKKDGAFACPSKQRSSGVELRRSSADWEKVFKTAYWNNRRFASEQLEHNLFEVTDNFLRDIYIVSEYAERNCHGQSAQEFRKQIADPLREYCRILLQFIDTKALHEKLHSAAPEFYSDVSATQKKLLDATIDFAAAQASLLYWQDAISGTMLQEILLLLRYEHLGSLIR